MTLNFDTVRREFLWMLIGLAAGLLVLPPLIWEAGSHVFGPYTGGSTRDLVDQFFRGLSQGEQAIWIVALGPYLAILTLRLTVAVIRAVRRQA